MWSEELVIPTYLPHAPDKNPMFLEKRVYQGSSGKVYPLPFTDRVSETKTERAWQAVWLENEYLRVLVLPEIGGRIHAIEDKTNGYDIIYRQTVIKPALVGLAGPWVSGGIEFNWPQHHRPATFLPVDFHIEEHADGSSTVWLSDHDPLTRMKGMHGVCLHPGRAYVELKVRAYNRTPFVQTFLWWANVATRVHEGYQSFFPPDAIYVADHAKRATSEYPLCTGFYYGVNYGERARRGVPADECPTQFIPPACQDQPPISYPPNDLSWYANIPVPTSYMCMGTGEDFFGGYDHFREAGIVHVADHHVSPGKKQWTWGNQEFGYAWDRNLTDEDGPYIELMAGVYTDNQPDFSFLQPGETKTWSQFFYPIQKIGAAQQANLNAAVCLQIESRRVRIGVSVTREFNAATVKLERKNGTAEWNVDLAPGRPFVIETPQARKPWKTGATTLRVLDKDGREVISYTPQPPVRGEVPLPATEPPPPEEVESVDELYVTGLHLEQYRHATRDPALYWREALRRDPLDSRSNNALGLWHLRRGEFAQAERHFRRSIERLTRRNPNPYDGEPFYNLGLCLRYQLDASAESQISAPAFDDAFAAFYKATWNQAWAAAGHHALAEMDCRRWRWANAIEHLERSFRFDTDNLRARDLKAVVLLKLERNAEAEGLLRETLALDPLDWWARHLVGDSVECDAQTSLDIAHDFARAGLYDEAIEFLSLVVPENASDLPTQSWGAGPLVVYTLGWLHQKRGEMDVAREEYRHASAHSPDYCFPSRLEEIAVLESAARANPRDACAPYYLGNLLYDRRRHEEAVKLWERSAELDPTFSVVWRNLGIGYFNVSKKSAKARSAYDRAFEANPADARLLYERDQLWKRTGRSPARRLATLETHTELVRQRDDLTVELCALYNQTGRHEQALALLTRNFQPWEGGEGQALGQHVRTHLALGRRALAACDAAAARAHFEAALASPVNFGEAKHLLANKSDIHYWLGAALDALGERTEAARHWTTAATFKGDFQEMSVRNFSEMAYYSALSLRRLGRKAEADALLRSLQLYADGLLRSEAKIDYFATSLPTMLLFEDDIQERQRVTATLLKALAKLGEGRKREGLKLLDEVLRRDPNHAFAKDIRDEVGGGKTMKETL